MANACAGGAVGELCRSRHRGDLRVPLSGSPSCCGPTQTARAQRRSARGEHPGAGARRAAHRRGPRRARSTCCSTSASAISRSSAARRRCRPASCSGCASRRRCARICSASSTCSTSRPPGCIPPTRRRCLRALDRLKAAGNSLFVVEHDLDVIRHADWIVDVGPAPASTAASPVQRPARGLAHVEESQTRALSLRRRRAARPRAARRRAAGSARRRHAQQPARARRRVSARRVHDRHRRVGLGQVQPRQPGARRAGRASTRATRPRTTTRRRRELERARRRTRGGASSRASSASSDSCASTRSRSAARRARTSRRTPGLFDHVRKLFAATKAARARRYDAGRFSFNVAKGRCETCEGEGFVCVELLFLPSVYAPCPTCHGARYNAKTLEITYRDKNIADVLGMTVDEACEFFADEAARLSRRSSVLREVGLGYLRLGQPATELSGGEAQRIKLATELQRVAARRHALRPRRADDRPASRRRREAADAARRPRRRRATR